MRNIILITREQENPKNIDFLFGSLPSQDKQLKFFYESLKCNYIDILKLKIGHKYFDIIINDTGANENQQATALLLHDHKIVGQINGDFIIAQANKNGDNIPLTENEIEYINNNLQTTKDNNNYEYVLLSY